MIADRAGATRLPGELDAERGAASILVLAIGLVLVAAGMAGAAVGAARVARHQARTVADFAALAGAARVIEGQQVACESARRIAVVNGGSLTYCELRDLDLIVHVEVLVPLLPGPARAAARAGPVSTPV